MHSAHIYNRNKSLFSCESFKAMQECLAFVIETLQHTYFTKFSNKLKVANLELTLTLKVIG